MNSELLLFHIFFLHFWNVYWPDARHITNNWFIHCKINYVSRHRTQSMHANGRLCRATGFRIASHCAFENCNKKKNALTIECMKNEWKKKQFVCNYRRKKWKKNCAEKTSLMRDSLNYVISTSKINDKYTVNKKKK